MANPGLISDVVAKEAQQQVDNIVTGLKEINKEISSINRNASSIELRMTDGGNIMASAKAVRDLADAQEALELAEQKRIKTQKALADAELKEERLRTQKQKTSQEEIKTQKLIQTENDKISKQKEREAKQNAELINDYGQLSKAANEAALRYKNLAFQLGANNRLTLEAKWNAQALQRQLKGLDYSVGQFQRNVGNYNAVGMQFNQILRELPNLAQSPQIFIMSLSNNLSYFAEALAEAKKQGQTGREIFATLGRNLFGLVGIINLAVIAASLLAKSFQKTGDEADIAKGKVDDLIASIDKYGKGFQIGANRRGEGTAGMRRDLAELEAEAASRPKTIASENKLLEARQKLTKAEIGDLKRQLDLYKEIQAIARQAGGINQGQAQSNSPLIIGRRALTRRGAGNIRNTMAGLPRDIRQQVSAQLASGELTPRKLAEQLDQITQQIEDKNSELLVNEANTAAAILQINKDMLDKLKKQREEWNQQMEKNFTAQYTTQSMQTNADADRLLGVANDESAPLNSRLDAYAEYYQKKMLLINEDAEYEIATGKKSAVEIEEINKQRDIKLRQLSDEALSYDLKIIEQQEAARKKAADEYTKTMQNLAKINTDSANRGKKAWAEFFNYLRDQAAQLLNNVISALAKGSQTRQENEIKRLDLEIERNERAKQVEIERIKASSLAAEEKERKIQEAEAKTESKRMSLEAQQRNRRRRAAMSERDATIGQIIVDTALAVVRALSDKTVPYPVRVGYAVAAGAIGVSQIAIARSAPLPEYEQGTLNHKGGRFIAGEKESELVLTPDGRMYMTADTPTMYNEKKGTKVLNQDMIATMLAGIEQGQMRRITGDRRERHDKRLANVIERAIKESSKDTVTAIRKNRSIFKANINVPDSYYNRKVKGK